MGSCALRRLVQRLLGELPEPRQVVRLIDIHLAAFKRKSYKRARWLYQQSSRAFVSPQHKQVSERFTREHRRDPNHPCIGRSHNGRGALRSECLNQSAQMFCTQSRLVASQNQNSERSFIQRLHSSMNGARNSLLPFLIHHHRCFIRRNSGAN